MSRSKVSSEEAALGEEEERMNAQCEGSAVHAGASTSTWEAGMEICSTRVATSSLLSLRNVRENQVASRSARRVMLKLRPGNLSFTSNGLINTPTGDECNSLGLVRSLSRKRECE